MAKSKLCGDRFFALRKVRFCAFLDPNGAGMSTTIDAICTLLAPDRGTVTVNGYTLGSFWDGGVRHALAMHFTDVELVLSAAGPSHRKRSVLV